MKDFESRLTRLEVLAERIREPSLPLEEAVGVFEEGIKLSRGLERDLEKIHGKVEILLNEPLENDSTKPEIGLFENQDTDEETV